MMGTTIFAQNYRGFKELDISLDGDMFLVGDNSSGKSSILHLINIVSQTDLHGIPRLDSQYYVDREDFFSPYFGYADVEIGFSHSDGSTNIGRIITLKRIKSASAYFVRSCTFAGADFAMSLRVRGSDIYGRVKRLDGLPDKNSLQAIHHNNSGFHRLKQSFDAKLNETSSLFPALVELAPDIAKQSDCMDVIFAQPMQNSRHIGPMRGRPEGFYAFDRRIKATGGHFATLLDDVSTTSPNECDDYVKSFGKESGLFDDLTVSRITKSIPNAPLNVTVKRNGRNFLLNQVGIGVSQVAPIIAETLAAAKGVINSHLFLIQQPELHLHPRAQAALGEYIFNVSRKGIRFCIETHSDFLIDRFRSKMRDKNDGEKATIVYCTNDDYGNHAAHIQIDKDGKLLNPPEGYLEFFINELSRTMI